MNEHPGHFWICFWLFLIWLCMPTCWQLDHLEKPLSKIAIAVSQPNTVR